MPYVSAHLVGSPALMSLCQSYIGLLTLAYGSIIYRSHASRPNFCLHDIPFHRCIPSYDFPLALSPQFSNYYSNHVTVCVLIPAKQKSLPLPPRQVASKNCRFCIFKLSNTYLVL